MREEIQVTVDIETIYEDVELPSYKHDGDSGMDVKAYFTDEWLHKNVFENDYLEEVKRLPKEEKYVPLFKGQTIIIPTGIKVAVPNGYEIQVRPRSGLAAKNNITVLNTPGTVDSVYRGEIGVILHFAFYPSSIENGYDDGPFKIHHGDRIAQIVLQEVPKISWNKVKTLDATERGEGGFGSTGTK